MAARCPAHARRRGGLLRPRRAGLARRAVPLAVAALVAACAPLGEPVVALDGASAADPAAAATLAIDPAHPLLLRGVDGRAVTTLQAPNALRSPLFLLPPGSHRLWASTVPYGHPLLPQSIGCYVVDAPFEAGRHYVLRYDPGSGNAFVDEREGGAGFVGRLVDRPFVFERSCRWE